MLTSSLKEEMARQTVDDVLESLSLEVMRDSIYQQIYDELPPNRDFLSIVLNKFNFIIESDELDDEIKALVNTEIAEFCDKIIDYIVGKFDLAYNEISGKETEIADMLYQFFVMRRSSNTETFVMRYIDENKSAIVEQLGLEKGSDVVFASLSKKITDPDTIKIVANVDSVINYITGLQIPAMDFLDVLSADGEYYTQMMIDYMEEQTIMGNFASEYMHGILSEYDSDYASQIRNDIRIRLGGMEE